jgi:glycosyltransferase involved in cell wall biosynthesis
VAQSQPCMLTEAPEAVAAPVAERPGRTDRQLAVFIPSLREGGAERSMLKLAGGLARRGHAVDLVLAQREGPYLAEVPPDVRIVDLAAPRVLRSLPALRRYLCRERPRALLSVMKHANVVALWAGRLAGTGTRIAVSERVALSPNVAHASRWSTRLMPLAIRLFYPWADAIVAVCEGVADDLALRAGLPRDAIDVVYNPIVTPEFQQRVRAPFEHPWFAPGEPPVVVAAGRLVPQKDFPTLLRAFARLRSSRAARLLILGEGPERPALLALAAELGIAADVGLPGFTANPYPYMARAGVFVLSSGWEGLPGALIEALYCRVPLISTDCPTGPREILQGGRYGVLVPVGDAPAMADGIERALAGAVPAPPAESWQRFELETVLDQYLAVLGVEPS